MDDRLMEWRYGMRYTDRRAIDAGFGKKVALYGLARLSEKFAYRIG